MSLIVAARFQTFEQASAAAKSLFSQGFSENDIHTFYVNTAGEHDRFPIGGDQFADADSKGASYGALAGAGVIGLVAAVMAGFIASQVANDMFVVLAAAGAGAYVGSLIGALWITGRGKRSHHEANALPDEAVPALRKAGVLLALHVSPEQSGQACSALRAAGGVDIERAIGRWVRGKWEDFDPLNPPVQDDASAHTTRAVV